ncbi:LTP_2 domain-containing protein [Cephalotus follicularis]|uniref:LTP_2 domain-containing protein n=1 Tax=Cephalotus follicularis TaxID=3775 RepID=A0A1Q3D0P3_CEPFO|nr:LTP_2 domain-containing protein [Cephalotus follicularis]
MTMGSHHLTLVLPFTFGFVLMSLVSNVISDSAKDREECADQLVGLATCLPYVGGDAKAPTPDCCSGLKQVLKSNKKCLCVVVRDRDDPELGLKINVTLALGLPSVCHAPADVSKCPALLHLDPNSPEAQVFYQFAGGSNYSASSPASAPSPTVKGSSKGSIAQQQSDGGSSGKRWLGLEIAAVDAVLWFFVSTSHFI